jgi:LPS export ABC transporter protein LptC
MIFRTEPCEPARLRPLRAAAGGLALALLLAAAAPAAAPAADPPPQASGPVVPAEVLANLEAELRIDGMTFVGSRGAKSEIVLHAEHALFRPDSDIAELEDVHVNGTDDGDRPFEVSCQQGELDVRTNDFLAEGDVKGRTGDGRRYAAPWVRYEHASALLYTDAPVVLEDERGTFRGDGFRYHLKEQRFRLIGNVRVVQQP